MAEKRKLQLNATTFGSLAYDLDTLARERIPEEPAQRRREHREVVQKPRTAVRVQPKVSLLAVTGVVMLAAMTVLMLLGYVQLNSIAQSVNEMKSQLNQLDDEHVALLTKYEQTYDLTTVKTKAEAAGMSKPTSGQIEYVDLSGSDNATVYRSGGISALNGLLSAAKNGWQLVLEFFD